MKTVPGKIFDSRIAAGGMMIAVGLAAIIASNFCSQWWQGVLQNIGSGLITSMLLIALYDRVIERRVQADLDERRKIAMRRLAAIVRPHIRGILFSMYRSAVESKPHHGMISFRDLVAQHLHAEIPKLNIMAKSDAGYPNSPLYAEWITQTFQVFSGKLESWVATYAICATSDVVRLSESILEAKFLTIGMQLDRLLTAMKQAPFVPDSMPFFTSEMVITYSSGLKGLVAEIEATLGENLGTIEDSDWENQFYPVGYARVQHQIPTPA